MQHTHIPHAYVFVADMQRDLIIPNLSIYIFLFLSVNKQPSVLRLQRMVGASKNIGYYFSSRDTWCKNTFAPHPCLMPPKEINLKNNIKAGAVESTFRGTGKKR